MSDGHDEVATSSRVAVTAGVAVGTVVLALALWEARTLVAIVFLGFVLATAMRPGVEALAVRGLHRVLGIALHYVALSGAAALVVWLLVPRLTSQVDAALAAPAGGADGQGASAAHQLLRHVDEVLIRAPVVHTAFGVLERMQALVVGIALVGASAAFWILERPRVIGYLGAFVEPSRRPLVERVWDAVELRLGRYVRRQLVLMAFVAALLSASFFGLGMPYWLALGIFAGVVEIVPVVGPLLAGVTAVGVAYTVSLQTAVLAALAVYGLRLLQDYVLGPRVLGGAIGLPPLVVLIAVSFAGVVFGPALVPLAMPAAAVILALTDVLLPRAPPRPGHAGRSSPEGRTRTV